MASATDKAVVDLTEQPAAGDTETVQAGVVDVGGGSRGAGEGMPLPALGAARKTPKAAVPGQGKRVKFELPETESGGVSNVVPGQQDQQVEVSAAHDRSKSVKDSAQASKDPHVEALKARFQAVYGRDVFHIMPKVYRHESHQNPSADLVKRLCKLARLNEANPLSLGDLRSALFAAARHRLLNVIDALGDKYIIASDVQHAFELREAAEAEDESEGETRRQNGSKTDVKRTLDTLEYPTASVRKKRKEEAAATPQTLKAKASLISKPLYTISRSAPDAQLLNADVFKQKLIAVLLADAKALLKNRLEAVNEIAAEIFASNLPSNVTALATVNGPMSRTQFRFVLMDCARGLLGDFSSRLLAFDRYFRQNGVLPRDGVKVSDGEQPWLYHFVDEPEFSLANSNLTFKTQPQITVVWARMQGSKRDRFWEVDD